MTNRAIYSGILAFAAAVAINATDRSFAETPGHATLMELVSEDLDAAQAGYEDKLVHIAGRRAAKAISMTTEPAPMMAPLMLTFVREENF